MNCWNCFYMLHDRMLIQSESGLILFWGGICMPGSAALCLNWHQSACCWLWVHGTCCPPSSLVLLVRWAGAALQSCLVSSVFFWFPCHPVCSPPFPRAAWRAGPHALQGWVSTAEDYMLPDSSFTCGMSKTVQNASQSNAAFLCFDRPGLAAARCHCWWMGLSYALDHTCDSCLSLFCLMPCEAAWWGCW